MVRTQVYLPEEIHRELLIRKKKEGTSVLRDDDPIWNIVGRVESREGDLSEKHDQYLYGKG